MPKALLIDDRRYLMSIATIETFASTPLGEQLTQDLLGEINQRYQVCKIQHEFQELFPELQVAAILGIYRVSLCHTCCACRMRARCGVGIIYTAQPALVDEQRKTFEQRFAADQEPGAEQEELHFFHGLIETLSNNRCKKFCFSCAARYGDLMNQYPDFRTLTPVQVYERFGVERF